MAEIRIIALTKDLLPVVQEWWAPAHAPAGLFPMNSTWLALMDDVPALTVSLYLTNCDVCYVENFVGNPALRGPDRQEATIRLLAHITRRAEELGYKRLICFAPNEKLRDYYKKIGFTETMNGLASFAKEI